MHIHCGPPSPFICCPTSRSVHTGPASANCHPEACARRLTEAKSPRGGCRLETSCPPWTAPRWAGPIRPVPTTEWLLPVQNWLPPGKGVGNGQATSSQNSAYCSGASGPLARLELTTASTEAIDKGLSSGLSEHGLHLNQHSLRKTSAKPESFKNETISNECT